MQDSCRKRRQLMSKLQRFNSFVGGLLTVFFGYALYMAPFMGVDMISIVMTATLLLLGIRNLYFYFSMAKHMVGGKKSLIYGIILIDLGVCAYMMQSFPPVYVMIYLLVIHSFYGATDIMVALRARRLKSKTWRIKLLTGLGNLTLGVLAIVFGFTGDDIFNVIYIYALGVAYTGIMRMANAFRRTAVPYIQ